MGSGGDYQSVNTLIDLTFGEGKGYLLQYSGLENSMGFTVHGVAKSRTQLSDFHSHRTWGRPRKLVVFLQTRGRWRIWQWLESVLGRPHRVLLGYKTVFVYPGNVQGWSSFVFILTHFPDGEIEKQRDYVVHPRLVAANGPPVTRAMPARSHMYMLQTWRRVSSAQDEKGKYGIQALREGSRCQWLKPSCP